MGDQQLFRNVERKADEDNATKSATRLTENSGSSKTTTTTTNNNNNTDAKITITKVGKRK